MTPLAFHTSMPRGTEVNASAPARSVQAQRDVWGRIETPLACTSADEQQAGIKPERAHTHTHTHTRDKICARIMIQHNTKPCVFPGACNEREHAPSSRKLEKKQQQMNNWMNEDSLFTSYLLFSPSPLVPAAVQIQSPDLRTFRGSVCDLKDTALNTFTAGLCFIPHTLNDTPLMTHPHSLTLGRNSCSNPTGWAEAAFLNTTNY